MSICAHSTAQIRAARPCFIFTYWATKSIPTDSPTICALIVRDGPSAISPSCSVLAKGVLADGVVNEPEADFIRQWVQAHPDAVEQWPVNVLQERLCRIYADGRVDETERDLAELLSALVGGRAGIIVGEDAATDLPVDQPPPQFIWPGSIFVFTGQFAFGPRAECERYVARLGGVCEPSITKRTNYLVIGTFGSRDWVHTPFGRKIEKAVEYRNAGHSLAIVNEDHWASALTENLG